MDLEDVFSFLVGFHCVLRSLESSLFQSIPDVAKAKKANTSTTASPSSENRPSFPTTGWSRDTW